ncbi:MAG: NAD(P)H-dependent oxidoreductase [Acidiferrobacterales bacterium]
MSLHRLLRERAKANPVRVGVIGAGKFASMFLAQARQTPGLHVMAVCDLDIVRARASFERTGWTGEQIGARSFEAAIRQGSTHLTEDAAALIAADGMEVVVDCTGDPTAGIRHALTCFDAHRHIVMVNVEADVLAGPLLARRARDAGVVYSLAYGDQPALIVELVDWARATGFDVVCAGKGTKYLPEYHASTPETVWQYYGLTPEQAARGGMNPKMFNSFLDGTKSAIEMAAVANATGLAPAPEGLAFPPSSVDALPQLLKPRSEGGVLHHKGTVEVVSSQNRDGSDVERDLRWGVYVTFEAPSDYTAHCLGEYGVRTDESGRYAALYRPYHLIGLELGISIASAALRGEATGTSQQFLGDVVAITKQNLRPGELLDGEGGYTVWGRLMPAADSLALGGLPIGLAHGVKLKNAVDAGQPIRWCDVEVDETSQAVTIRREMETLLRPAAEARATG